MDKRLSTVSEWGALVRNRRKKLGYTQARLAELCRTGTRFISDLENGKETMELGKALTVAASLGIDIFARERGAS
jgi:y4mF family transcriptional regulator